MSNRIDDIGRMRSSVDAANRSGVFDGRKNPRLGTEKNPARVTVQTDKRLKEITSLFETNRWKFRITLAPDQPEDIADLTRLLNPQKPKVAETKVGRNAACPCGSGKKYKNCCGP